MAQTFGSVQFRGEDGDFVKYTAALRGLAAVAIGGEEQKGKVHHFK